MPYLNCVYYLQVVCKTSTDDQSLVYSNNLAYAQFQQGQQCVSDRRDQSMGQSIDAFYTMHRTQVT